ncbi:hypothetical protein [Rhodoblastus sp.]|jgi:hypothetical protein|uniref:hypothetical protein n=1 Tax=Rhodoblastus sp. TaxID=1962975 RepID=UPI0025DB1852|nr:hypothetical protein [Rhodoblastus sp.]
MTREAPFTLAALAALALPAFAGDGLPVNHDVTEANIGETICRPSWTQMFPAYGSTIRTIKAEMLAAIGEPLEHLNRWTIDHRIPLVLAGHPVERRNLALQPIAESRAKDEIEACLLSRVYQGQLSLKAAQQAIWQDWRQAGELCTEHARVARR